MFRPFRKRSTSRWWPPWTAGDSGLTCRSETTIDLCSRSSRASVVASNFPFASQPTVALGVSCHLITTPRKPTLSLFTTLLFRLTKPDPF